MFFYLSNLFIFFNRRIKDEKEKELARLREM